jgi:hypothetical protein
VAEIAEVAKVVKVVSDRVVAKRVVVPPVQAVTINVRIETTLKPIDFD